MSTRELALTILNSLTEEQLQAFVTLFGNPVDRIPEVEPDDWDKEMIQRAKAENDGETISIEELAAETGIDYESL